MFRSTKCGKLTRRRPMGTHRSRTPEVSVDRVPPKEWTVTTPQEGATLTGLCCTPWDALFTFYLALPLR